MDTNKILVGKIVEAYKKLCPGEYADFLESNKKKVEATKDRFAEIKGSDMVHRKLFEIPETLHAALRVKMTDEQWEWFRTKEASTWFAIKYRQFRASADV